MGGRQISPGWFQRPRRRGSASLSQSLHRGSPGTVMRLESITVFEECFPSHVMLLDCLSVGPGAAVACSSVSCSRATCPCPVRRRSSTLGRPARGSLQMPALGDTRDIALTRQTWLRDRFPCHVGLLAELCSNPEAYHLQQTLTIVWDHLLFPAGSGQVRGLCTPFPVRLPHTKADGPGERLRPATPPT